MTGLQMIIAGLHGFLLVVALDEIDQGVSRRVLTGLTLSAAAGSTLFALDGALIASIVAAVATAVYLLFLTETPRPAS